MSSFKVSGTIQMLIVVVAVGAIAIGALKLFSSRSSNVAEPFEMEGPESEGEVSDVEPDESLGSR